MGKQISTLYFTDTDKNLKRERERERERERGGGVGGRWVCDGKINVASVDKRKNFIPDFSGKVFICTMLQCCHRYL